MNNQSKVKKTHFAVSNSSGFLLAIRKWKWLILAIIILSTLLSFCYAKIILRPVYQSEITVYAGITETYSNSASTTDTESKTSSGSKNTDSQDNTKDTTATDTTKKSTDHSLETFTEIVQSQKVLNQVIKNTGCEYSYEELSDMVSVSQGSSDELLKVAVQSKDPYEARYLGNSIGVVLPDKIPDVLSDVSVKILDYADIPTEPIDKNVSGITLIGFIIGLLISLILCFVTAISDNVIHSEKDLKRKYPDVPVLAVVPDLRSSDMYSGYETDYNYLNNKGEEPVRTVKHTYNFENTHDLTPLRERAQTNQGIQAFNFSRASSTPQKEKNEEQ